MKPPRPSVAPEFNLDDVVVNREPAKTLEPEPHNWTGKGHDQVVSNSTGKDETFRTSLYFHRDVHDVLRKLAFDERRKVSDLINEGIDKLFKSRGMPSIREIERQRRK